MNYKGKLINFYGLTDSKIFFINGVNSNSKLKNKLYNGIRFYATKKSTQVNKTAAASAARREKLAADAKKSFLLQNVLRKKTKKISMDENLEGVDFNIALQLIRSMRVGRKPSPIVLYVSYFYSKAGLNTKTIPKTLANDGSTSHSSISLSGDVEMPYLYTSRKQARSDEKLCVFTLDETTAEKAREMGAIVGTKELVRKIEEKGPEAIKFTKLITTPECMRMLTPIARILGPRGLMPSPRRGTVVTDLDEYKKKFASVVTIKGNEARQIVVPVGDSSWSAQHIVDNIFAVLNKIRSILDTQTDGSGGVNKISKITLTSTKTPGIVIKKFLYGF